MKNKVSATTVNIGSWMSNQCRFSVIAKQSHLFFKCSKHSYTDLPAVWSLTEAFLHLLTVERLLSSEPLSLSFLGKILWIKCLSGKCNFVFHKIRCFVYSWIRKLSWIQFGTGLLTFRRVKIIPGNTGYMLVSRNTKGNWI